MIERSAYETKLLDAVGAKESVKEIDEQFGSDPAQTDRELSFQVRRDGRYVTVHTNAVGSAYDISWSIEISPKHTGIELYQLDVQKNEVVYKFPPGEYKILATVEYRTEDGEQKETFTRSVVIQ